MSAVHTLKIDISLVVRAKQNMMKHQQEHTMQDTEWLLRRLEELRSTRQQRCHPSAISRTGMKTIASSAHTAVGAAAAIGARGVVAIGTGNQAQAAAVWASFCSAHDVFFVTSIGDLYHRFSIDLGVKTKINWKFQMFLEVIQPKCLSMISSQALFFSIFRS